MFRWKHEKIRIPNLRQLRAEPRDGEWPVFRRWGRRRFGFDLRRCVGERVGRGRVGQAIAVYTLDPGDGGFDFFQVQQGGIEQVEDGAGVLAADQLADQGALLFDGFEFVLGQGEAVAGEQEMHGEGDVAGAARGAEIGGASGGHEVGRAAGDAGDFVHDPVEMFAEHQAEEVVHVADGAADEELGEAGGVGEFGQGESCAPEPDEHVVGGFEDVFSPGAFARRFWRGAETAIRVGSEESGWDGVHKGNIGRRSGVGQGKSWGWGKILEE